MSHPGPHLGGNRGATSDDMGKLADTADAILGKSFCALGDDAASPVASSIQRHLLPRSSTLSSEETQFLAPGSRAGCSRGIPARRSWTQSHYGPTLFLRGTILLIGIAALAVIA